MGGEGNGGLREAVLVCGISSKPWGIPKWCSRVKSPAPVGTA